MPELVRDVLGRELRPFDQLDEGRFVVTITVSANGDDWADIAQVTAVCEPMEFPDGEVHCVVQPRYDNADRLGLREEKTLIPLRFNVVRHLFPPITECAGLGDCYKQRYGQ